MCKIYRQLQNKIVTHLTPCFFGLLSCLLNKRA